MFSRRLWALPFSLVLATGLGQATSIRPVNLREMLQLADRVFVGTVIEVRHKPGPGGIPVRVTRFRVSEVVKGGLQKSKEVALTQVWAGSHRQKGVRPLPAPGFVAGEEVIVFLHGDSPLGLSSPVGFGLGKLSVDRVGGRKFVRFTPEQRVVLLRSLEREAGGPFGLNESAPATGTVPVETIVSWLKGQVAR